MTSPDAEARPEGPLRLGAFRSSTTGPAAGLDLLRLLQLARRRLRLAVLVAVGLTAAAAVGIARLPSRYAAEALVVLNDRPSKLADLRSPTEGLLSRTQADLSVVKTETEIQMRQAMAWGSLFFVFLGAPVGILFARRDFLSAFISCFMPIIIAYYPLMLFGVNLGKEGIIPPVFVWIGNVVLWVVAIVWVRPPVMNH